MFGTLLDRQAGYFRLGPFGVDVPTARAYEPGTNILSTTWNTQGGWVVVRDALTTGPHEGEDAVTPDTRPPADDDADHTLVRTATCIDGQVEVELVCEPVFDYGREGATWTLVEGSRHVADATGAGQTIRLHTDMSSKLMCWVAMDRAGKLAEIGGDADLAATWHGTAEEIRADILAHGVDHRGVLRQHYDTDALDASNLLAGIFGFLPGDDERLRNTVLAMADELTDHGFVLRYRTDETDDGLSGKEGTFLICSFWLVSALVIIREIQRARDLMERLLRVASPLGLYAEEFDTDTAHHLGNFPQAFSHLALIEATARIVVLERVTELR